jgi:uncharacterized protein (UPF0333 family)
MVDNKGQTSAEFILLVGGIIVVVLLTLMFYRNYITGLSGEIKGEEVSNFNGKLDSLSDILLNYMWYRPDNNYCN